MPVGDIPGWHMIFSDDFNANVPVGEFSGCRPSPPLVCRGFPASVRAKWWAYPDGWPDTSGNGEYYPSTVLSEEGSILNMHLHTADGIHMVAAPVPLLPKQDTVGSEGGLEYGRYVIRFRADAISGYKTAWLLWPESENGLKDGEIDFPEGNLTGNIDAFMHWQNGTSGKSHDAYMTDITYTVWHTAEIDWTPTSVTFLLDGVKVGESTAKIPDTPMHWVLQTETSTVGPVPTNTASGNVQVDWVAVYVPSNNPQPQAAF